MKDSHQYQHLNPTPTHFHTSPKLIPTISSTSEVDTHPKAPFRIFSETRQPFPSFLHLHFSGFWFLFVYYCLYVLSLYLDHLSYLTTMVLLAFPVRSPIIPFYYLTHLDFPYYLHLPLIALRLLLPCAYLTTDSRCQSSLLLTVPFVFGGLLHLWKYARGPFRIYLPYVYKPHVLLCISLVQISI